MWGLDVKVTTWNETPPTPRSQIFPEQLGEARLGRACLVKVCSAPEQSAMVLLSSSATVGSMAPRIQASCFSLQGQQDPSVLGKNGMGGGNYK